MGDASAANLPGIDFDLATLLQTVESEDSPFGEYVMDCPVCKSAVRYFFVNFNEKVKMCENSNCDYPFGYEDLEFVKHDEMFASDDELDNVTVKTRRTATNSIISTSAWSDIDKLEKVDEAENDSEGTARLETDVERDARLIELSREKEAEIQTKRNLLHIKKLNIQLQQTYDDDDDIACIKNEKWIKHLKALQTLSGVQLLKKEELAIIKKEELLGQELTIGINTEESSPSITINLAIPKTSANPIERVAASTTSTTYPIERVEVPPTSSANPIEGVEVPPTSPANPTEGVTVLPTSPSNLIETVEVPPTSPANPMERVEVPPTSPANPMERVGVPPTSPVNTTERVEVPPTSPANPMARVGVSPTSPANMTERVEVPPTSPANTTERVEVPPTFPANPMEMRIA